MNHDELRERLRATLVSRLRETDEVECAREPYSAYLLVQEAADEIETLRAALKPFAECGPLMASSNCRGADSPQDYSVVTKHELTLAHFREAMRISRAVRSESGDVRQQEVAGEGEAKCAPKAGEGPA